MDSFKEIYLDDKYLVNQIFDTRAEPLSRRSRQAGHNNTYTHINTLSVVLCFYLMTRIL